jgi:hypothetical protein
LATSANGWFKSHRQTVFLLIAELCNGKEAKRRPVPFSIGHRLKNGWLIGYLPGVPNAVLHFEVPGKDMHPDNAAAVHNPWGDRAGFL